MSILITGGTGSLGQALTKRLLTDNLFEKIIIYSRSESKQELMQHALSQHPRKDCLRFFIGDIRDSARLATALRGNDVTTIVNCAALKVVPVGEYNPIEFIKTNINGMQNVIEAAAEFRVSRVLQISTDKAVYPINLYGATKLTSEKMILAANNMYGQLGPRYGFCRYGNVVGSNGSVVPLFIRQYNHDLPFTITDPLMTRFWVTMDEAVELVLIGLQELSHVCGSRVFIPKMKATRVVDVAEAIGGPNYKCSEVGARPGEKMHEAMYTQDEVFPGVARTSDVAELMSVEEIRAALKQLKLL